MDASRNQSIAFPTQTLQIEMPEPLDPTADVVGSEEVGRLLESARREAAEIVEGTGLVEGTGAAAEE